MQLYRALNPDAEVKGETILTFVAGTGIFKDNTLKFLRENGIDSPKPDGWYSQQAWLNSFRAIAEKYGNNTLKMIGRSMPEGAGFPDGIDSTEAALASLDAIYHANHRSGEIGSYEYVKTGERSACIVCNNPFPCAFNEGLIRATAELFRSADSQRVTVAHGEDHCIDNGGLCTFHIQW